MISKKSQCQTVPKKISGIVGTRRHRVLIIHLVIIALCNMNVKIWEDCTQLKFYKVYFLSFRSSPAPPFFTDIYCLLHERGSRYGVEYR